MQTPWFDAAITGDDVADDPQMLCEAGFALADMVVAASASVVAAVMASLRIMILKPLDRVVFDSAAFTWR